MKRVPIEVSEEVAALLKGLADEPLQALAGRSTVRMNVEVDSALFEAFRAECAERGVTISTQARKLVLEFVLGALKAKNNGGGS